MAVLQFVVYDILGEASLLIGLMAMVGLLIQRKPAEKVIAGTIKTIVGFLIFGIGSSAAQGALNGFQSLFVTAFGLEGVTPISEAITAQAQTLFPMVIALIMVGGFVCNLVIAKLTKFKYIFPTGGHSLFLSALLAILLKALGLSDVAAILIGSVIHGFAAALYPAIAQKSMNAVTGTDEIAIGHYCTLAYAFSGWLGSKVGDPEDSTEKIKLPGWLSMFKDYIVSVSLSIGVIYYIAAAVAGREAVEAISGGTHWLIFPLMQTLTFTGGLYVIITGVRLFLGEIVPAFVGISEKFIPGAKPALDCPVVFPYAPHGYGFRLYFRLCGRPDLHVYHGRAPHGGYDPGGDPVLLHRRYRGCVWKCQRRLEGLRAGRLCDRRTDFRRPGHHLPDHAERGLKRHQLPGNGLQPDRYLL